MLHVCACVCVCLLSQSEFFIHLSVAVLVIPDCTFISASDAENPQTSFERIEKIKTVFEHFVKACTRGVRATWSM